MVCFRIVERMGLTKCFASDAVSFALTTVLTLAGSSILSVAARWGIEKVGNLTRKVYAKHAEI